MLASGECGDIPSDPLGRFDKEGNVIEPSEEQGGCDGKNS